MNNKKVLIIAIAALLAIFVAFFIAQKKSSYNQLEDKPEIVTSEDVNLDKSSLDESTLETNKEAEKPEILSNITAKEKKDISYNTKQITTQKESNLPTFTKLELREEQKQIEKVGITFDDPGIHNDNGTIVVTRDFKIKSPRKYSFKDFGVLAEPPIR